MGYTRRVVARLMAMACALYLGSLIRLLSELSPQGAGPGASMHAAWLAGGLARRGLLLLTGLPTLTAYAVQQHWANGELAAVLVTTCCTLAVWRVPVSATEGRRPPASEPAPPPAAAAAAAGPRPFQLPPPTLTPLRPWRSGCRGAAHTGRQQRDGAGDQSTGCSPPHALPVAACPQDAHAHAAGCAAFLALLTAYVTASVWCQGVPGPGVDCGAYERTSWHQCPSCDSSAGFAKVRPAAAGTGGWWGQPGEGRCASMVLHTA